MRRSYQRREPHGSGPAVRERDDLPALDDWLTTIFAPHRLDHTVRSLAEAQAEPPAPTATDADTTDLAIVLAECDAKLARYQAALDAGADPVAVASWTRSVEAERAAAVAAAAATPRATRSRLSEGEIRNIIETIGDLATVIKDADPADKARIYAGLSLRLTYQPAKQIVRAEVDLDSHAGGAMVCVRGGT